MRDLERSFIKAGLGRMSRKALALAAVSCALVVVPFLAASGMVNANPGITFRAATSGSNSMSNSLQLAVPSGASSGDVLLASVDVIQSPTVTIPGGWTLVRTDTSTASTRMSQALFTHVVTASEPGSYTWRFSAAEAASGGIVDYSGVDTTNPIDASSGQTALKSTQITAPSLTTSMANDTLVGSFGFADTGAITSPSGMTQRFSDTSSNQPGQRTTGEVTDQSVAAPGPVGSRVVTLTQAVNGIGQLVALRPDVTPPTTPSNLAQTANTMSSLTLNWQPSTDNSVVAGYTVYQNGNPITTTTAASYTVNGLVCGLSYPLSVDAFDTAGNHSGQATIVGTTAACPDTTPPSAPANIVQTGNTDTTATIGWDASTDDVGVAGYTVYQNGVQLATTSATDYTITGLVCESSYNVSVDAFDAAGNYSGQTGINVSSAACPDTTPPTVSITSPASGTTDSGKQILVSASATDSAGIANVQFAIDGTPLGSPLTSGPYSVALDTTAIANGTHVLTATATDLAGNSATSSPVTVVIDNNPVVDSVSINQTSPATNDLLSASVASHDPLGNSLTYNYQWILNGSNIPGATSPTLDLSQGGNGNKGDSIALQVIASDGTYTSNPVVSSPVTIVNSPPTANVSLSTVTPDTDATVTATAAVNDADGDPVTLTYIWSVNGKIVQTTTAGLTSSLDLSLPGNGNYGDTVTVQVTPNDGTTDGLAVSASAAVTKPPTGTMIEYPLSTPALPSGLTNGPDGNLWFSLEQNSSVGRITPTGVITLFLVPTPGNLGGINPGPDGNIWFTEYNGNKIGRITTSGSVTEFPLKTPSAGLGGIVAGSDGNLWFAETLANKIGKITPSGVITEYPIPTASAFPHGLNPGPDGNIWFNELNGNKIGKITPSGVFTEYKILTPSAKPDVIIAGPDGNMWFTEDVGKIARITTSGVITEFPLVNSSAWPVGITTGPDGNLWFTEKTANKIGRITPSGVITEFPVLTASSQPDKIVSGPDGNLWFTEHNGDKIGRITP
ncbi:MAG TPA: Ig-like domain-containing protein [Candidatus Dormibacteraeota bacterium]|nr:Ig-like domain-containing protein [Candidatus Dormibacteraeota bacterium]